MRRPCRRTLFVCLGEEADWRVWDVDRAMDVDERLVGPGNVELHSDVVIAGRVRIVYPEDQILARQLISVYAHLVANPRHVGQMSNDHADRARVPRVDDITDRREGNCAITQFLPSPSVGSSVSG